jgi:hypothetical protein
MAIENSSGEPAGSSGLAGGKKLPYEKPSFRCEKVFVTSALGCGKVDQTQGQCIQVQKS